MYILIIISNNVLKVWASWEEFGKYSDFTNSEGIFAAARFYSTEILAKVGHFVLFIMTSIVKISSLMLMLIISCHFLQIILMTDN